MAVQRKSLSKPYHIITELGNKPPATCYGHLLWTGGTGRAVFQSDNARQRSRLCAGQYFRRS